MNAKEFSPVVLRVGLALVVLWFGISQVISPDNWTGFLPQWLPTFGLTAQTHILINGSVEIIVGLLLLAGLFTRIAAAVGSAHMYAVTLAVGYGAVGIRDFGLCMGLIALALYGPDSLSLDSRRRGGQENTKTT